MDVGISLVQKDADPPIIGRQHDNSLEFEKWFSTAVDCLAHEKPA
jgi:hypothetical protein